MNQTSRRERSVGPSDEMQAKMHHFGIFACHKVTVLTQSMISQRILLKVLG